MSDCIIKPDNVPGYVPDAHTGTINRRLIGRETGAKNLDVILGTVAPGGQAEPHSHRDTEQAVSRWRCGESGRCQIQARLYSCPPVRAIACLPMEASLPKCWLSMHRRFLDCSHQ
ncbi:MAG: hypothetical protein Q7R34_05510 [Dehalococcoidia bacterium]|nr:hypothetical protein [Dehalococcoidia bacterium]